MDTAFYSLGYQKNQRILYVIFQNVHFGLYILNFINKHSRETQLGILLHFTYNLISIFCVLCLNFTCVGLQDMFKVLKYPIFHQMFIQRSLSQQKTKLSPIRRWTLNLKEL